MTVPISNISIQQCQSLLKNYSPERTKRNHIVVMPTMIMLMLTPRLMITVTAISVIEVILTMYSN